jgi:serine/threonine protein kinase
MENRFNYEQQASDGSDSTLDRNTFKGEQQALVNANALQLGRVLGGRYQLLEVLGEGGMSAVFLSRHRELDQLVAIKVLRFDRSAGDDSLKRFLQEAKATFQLNHPNLIRLLDFSSGEEDLPYLVMEYVSGKTLAELLRERGRLEVQEFVDIFSQVCDGLSYAHSRGIIHRDLKPSNIMLATEMDGTQIVKIVDFGIAKMTHSDNEQHLTKTGEIFGSPFYMSPEQCRGLSPDHRSDLYSIGCAMFECLSGSVPYCGENSIRTLFMHIEEPIPTLKLPNYKSFAVARALEQVTERLLQKDPGNRFQSASEVKKSLLACLERSDRQRVDGDDIGQKTTSRLALAPASKMASNSAPLYEVPGGLNKKVLAVAAAITFIAIILGGMAVGFLNSGSGFTNSSGLSTQNKVASTGANDQHDKASIESDPGLIALQQLKDDLHAGRVEADKERAEADKERAATDKVEREKAANEKAAKEKALKDKAAKDKIEKQKREVDKQKREIDQQQREIDKQQRTAREQGVIRQAHSKLVDKVRDDLARVQDLKNAGDLGGAEEICSRAVEEAGGIEAHNPVVRSAYFTYLTLLMARPEKERPYGSITEIAQRTSHLMFEKPALNSQQQMVVYGALGQGLMRTGHPSDAVTYFSKAAERAAAENTEKGDVHFAAWEAAELHAMARSGQMAQALSGCQRLEKIAITQNKPPLALFIIQTTEASLYAEDRQANPARDALGRASDVLKRTHIDNHNREYGHFVDLYKKLNMQFR